MLAGVLSLAVLGMTSAGAFAAHSACSDGIDNDGNGRIDYPQDDACESLDDDYEGISLTGNFVTVTDDKEKVAPGGSVVYIVTLKQQREDARLVNVTLHLPHQSNVTSASDGGAVGTDVIRWTNVSVYRNITRKLQVHVNINPYATPGQYVVARVIADGAEATDTTLVEEYVPVSTDNFSVRITDNRDFVQPGERVTYAAKVRNTSDSATTSSVRVHFPTETYFESNSTGGQRDSYTVTWPSVTFAAGEEKLFTVTASIDPKAHDRGAIRARVSVGTAVSDDTTIVKVGLPYNAITTAISDGLSSAEKGQNLTYRITVHNSDNDVVGTNIGVDAALPLYGEFVSANDNGYFDGSNVRWLVVNMAPKETRVLTFTVRIRPDAPVGAVLTASAVADGVTGSVSRDTTDVVEESNEVSSFERENRDILFRKTADRQEAFPGGSIRYTLSVRNTLDHVISDAIITDRYDDASLTLSTYDMPENLIDQASGTMRWKVPVLQPGESWQTSYVLAVAPHAKPGMVLENVATIRGADLDNLSLTQKVTMARAGVIGALPQTGADMGALAGLLGAAIAMGSAYMQRKIVRI